MKGHIKGASAMHIHRVENSISQLRNADASLGTVCCSLQFALEALKGLFTKGSYWKCRQAASGPTECRRLTRDVNNNNAPSYDRPGPMWNINAEGAGNMNGISKGSRWFASGWEQRTAPGILQGLEEKPHEKLISCEKLSVPLMTVQCF